MRRRGRRHSSSKFAGRDWAGRHAERRPTGREKPPLPAKAKNVIFLFMAGAPSHLELFDYKPQLAKFNGTLPPPELLKAIAPRLSTQIPSCSARSSSLKSTVRAARKFRSCCPHFSTIVDDVAIVKSMVTDAFNHAPGQLLMNTGTQHFGRPSMGAWVTYGLGNESKDLPAFIVFSSGKKGPAAETPAGAAAFFPPLPRRTISRQRRSGVVSFQSRRHRHRRATGLARCHPQLNEMRQGVTGDPEIATRINSFEMAYRMQSSAPELMDLIERAAACVRYVWRGAGQTHLSPTIACWRGAWWSAVCASCSSITKPGTNTTTSPKTSRSIARIRIKLPQRWCRILKQRGLLDSTLVIWGGEFGRTPMVQGGSGRARSSPECVHHVAWRAAASSRALPLARAMNWDST